MQKRPVARFVNGIASAIAVVFFVAHALLGSLEGIAPLSGPPPWVMWAGVAVVAFHVLASVATSYQQLTDREFPPSTRKRRHLALKWATGGLLAAAIAAHVACVQSFGPDAAQVTATGAVAAIALAAVLAVHLCVGAKSLLVDLGLNKGHMNAFRIAVVVLAVLVIALILAGALP